MPGRRPKKLNFNKRLIGAVPDKYLIQFDVSPSKGSTLRRKKGYVTVYENILKISFFHLSRLLDTNTSVEDFVSLILPFVIHDARTATALEKGVVNQEDLKINDELIRGLKYLPDYYNNGKIKADVCSLNGVMVEVAECIVAWFQKSRNKAWDAFFDYYKLGDVESALSTMPTSDAIILSLRGEGPRTSAQAAKSKSNKASQEHKTQQSEVTLEESSAEQIAIDVDFFRVTMLKEEKELHYYISSTSFERAMIAITQAIKSNTFEGEFSLLHHVGTGLHL